MRIIKTVSGMQRLALEWKRKAVKVGFVPTMGYLHAGHMSLVERARREVGPKGRVIVSIYVNPTQFGPNEDFSRYPRDFDRDARLCRSAGVDTVFAPADEHMYAGRAAGLYSTYVVEEKLSTVMEGASRPGHFRGVTTVVAKLFNLVLPDVAVFGAKDYQQVAVIRRMVKDLSFPVRIVTAPTLREPDGLAMSSRNKYLQGDERQQALVLSKIISEVRATIRSSRTAVPARRLESLSARLVEEHPAAKLDYIEFFNPETLEPVSRVWRGCHLALAVYVGKTRLIDNGRL